MIITDKIDNDLYAIWGVCDMCIMFFFQIKNTMHLTEKDQIKLKKILKLSCLLNHMSHTKSFHVQPTAHKHLFIRLNPIGKKNHKTKARSYKVNLSVMQIKVYILP